MATPTPAHSSDKIRDHLANERTFLAWVRTSIALLGFGVVIAKLRFLMVDEAVSPATAHAIPAAGQGGRSLLLGLAFCAVGLLTLILSVVSYGQSRSRIDAGTYTPPGTILVAFVVIVTLLAAASILFLLNLGQ